MYLELDQQYNRHKKLHAIDVDLYVNSISNDAYTEELEDILYKFRLTPSTVDTMDSTQHAVIRLYLKLNKTQELLEILDDRLNYGVFPDEYCNNLLINHFIKSNNYRDASKIASLQMLQEDFSNEITKYFSLYSCLKYLQAPTPWNTRTEEKSTTEANDDDEDEVKVRVQYLRNPYFDGHFDLKTANELIGKTLITIGRLSPEDVLHQSYYLIGLGLTKDAKEAEQFLKNVESGKVKVALEGLELFKKYLTSADVGAPPSSSNESTPEGEKVDAAPANNQAIIGEEFQVVLDLAEKVKGSGVNVNLLEITENKVKEVVLQFEAQEIEKQKQKYKEWDIGREKILLQHLEKLKEEEIFQTIEEKKAELAKEEERIFFFDNENQIDLLLEEKYPPKEEVVVKKRNEFDGKRNLGRTNVNKSKKSVVDENYVPPDLHKPYNH
ncbi:hypothetical protein M8J76_012074 [Diaphorina citri]|nr:hypothetical protein M8J75_006398 [Diaphorina citri]KAI5733444.1 hypothetical protein M8J76_012074 [Diaphorina citri]KAI5739335.1 hypothetical protein M8J77_018042 [Diaphorina citri]